MSKNFSLKFAELVILLTGLFLGGCVCAHVGDPYCSEIKPIKTEDGYEYFEFTALTDWFEDSEYKKCESDRMHGLRFWMGVHGYKDVEYEILSRKKVQSKGFLSGQWLVYEVRVKENEKKKR